MLNFKITVSSSCCTHYRREILGTYSVCLRNLETDYKDFHLFSIAKVSGIEQL